MKRSFILTITALVALAGARLLAQPPQRQLTPEQLAQQAATREDHQRMMKLLNIFAVWLLGWILLNMARH